MTANPQETTQQTYAAIAADYAAFNKERRGIAPLLDRFCAALPAPGPLLDAGCGPGFDAAYLRAQGHRAIGLDLSPAMMQAGRPFFPTVSFTQGDLRRLPFGDGAFAGVWLLASLLHLSRADTAVALIEARRVLQPGGVAFVSVKQGEGAGWSGQVAGSNGRRFFTYWQPDALDAVLNAAGFAVTWRHRTGIWLSRLAVKQE